MGITEQILDMARQEGEKVGLRKGRAVGLREGKTAGRNEGLLIGKTEFVKNLLQHTSHSIEDIARLANVSEIFILEISKGSRS